MKRRSNIALLASALALFLGACAMETATDQLTEEDELNEAESLGLTHQALASGTLKLNDVYFVTASPGVDGGKMYSTATTNVVLRRLAPQAAVKVVIAAPSNGRYRVDHAGILGWIAGTDLTIRHNYDSALSGTRINALARARAAMGFSYWWSNAKWPASGGATKWPTNNVGTCSGACGGNPACTHSATGGTEYGADCSGFISTIWGFPDFDSTTNPTNNGFSTGAYNSDTASWSTVTNASARPADAMVQYVTGGTKHIFLISTARNAVGRSNTYECRNCSFGCMTNVRDVSNGSGWHAIRRTGW